MKMKEHLDQAKVANQDAALAKEAGQAFYNSSPFTLRRLLDNPKQLRANFEAYLNGFSVNVQEILLKFKFHNQIPTLSDAGAVGYEPDSELRDTEQVPFLEEGGIQTFFKRECLPYVPDAWIDESKTKIGYELSFTRYFYKPQPLRTLDEIKADIFAVESESEGLLEKILGGSKEEVCHE